MGEKGCSGIRQLAKSHAAWPPGHLRPPCLRGLPTPRWSAPYAPDHSASMDMCVPPGSGWVSVSSWCHPCHISPCPGLGAVCMAQRCSLALRVPATSLCCNAPAFSPHVPRTAPWASEHSMDGRPPCHGWLSGGSGSAEGRWPRELELPVPWGPAAATCLLCLFTCLGGHRCH